MSCESTWASRAVVLGWSVGFWRAWHGIAKREEATLVGLQRAADWGREGEKRIANQGAEASHGAEEDLEAGPPRLRQHIRDQERGFQRYMANLQAVKGVCILCRLLPVASHGQAGEHTLEQCGRVQKWEFIKGKRAAMDYAKSRGRGWLPRYAACYRCGNAQEVCPEQGGDARACEFRDIVFPSCWGAFQREEWRHGRLREMEVEEHRPLQSEQEYMAWLGEEREVFGMRAINAVYVADGVIQAYLV